MKRVVFLAVVLFLILSVSALEFDVKSEYNSGETLLGKVSGNIIDPLGKDNFYFYRDNVKVPIEIDVTKINSDYYLYAILPEVESNKNYSIVLRNVRYYKGSKLTNEEIRKNFTISENKVDFTLKPGFVITSGKFYLTIQNIQDSKINLKVSKSTIDESSSAVPSEKTWYSFSYFFSSAHEEQPTAIGDSGESISLNSGEIKSIGFKAEANSSVLASLEISSPNTQYQIPVYVMINYTKIPNATSMEFSPPFFNVIMGNVTMTRKINLNNTGNNEIGNISLSVSSSIKEYVSVSPSNITSISPGKQQEIEITITPKDKTEYLEGEIYSESDSSSAYLPIAINITKNYSPPPNQDNNQNDNGVVINKKTCSQMSGKFCSGNEECNGELKDAFDGKCCVGTCQEKKKSEYLKYAGYGILIIVILFLLWVFFKYKQVRRGVRIRR